MHYKCTKIRTRLNYTKYFIFCTTLAYFVNLIFKQAQELGEPVGAPCAPFGLSGNKQFHEIKTQLGEVVRGRARGMWMEDVRYLEVRCDVIVLSTFHMYNNVKRMIS